MSCCRFFVILISYTSQVFAYCDKTLNHSNEILVLCCPNFDRNAALKVDSYAEEAVKILNEMAVLSLNLLASNCMGFGGHDDVIIWKHLPRYWPFVRKTQRSPVNSPHIGQWRGALMLPFIWAWTNDWVNNGDAGDLRRHRAHYDVTVMKTS